MLRASTAATTIASNEPSAPAAIKATQNGVLSARTELAVRRRTTTSSPLVLVAYRYLRPLMVIRPVGLRRQEQARLLLRKDGQPLVLRGEKAADLAGRRMEVLVREQADLPLESAECTLFQRPPHEIGTDEQREGDGGEDSGADPQPQARLQRDHVSGFRGCGSRRRGPSGSAGRPSFLRSCAT